jgi:ABC-type lipoprotein export system ATPase subunit
MEIKIEDSLQLEEPFRLTIYGDHGTGKTSLLEKHGLYYNYENGMRFLKAKQINLVGKPYEATPETSKYIYKNAKELLKQHSCLVIDSLDFLEKAIIDSVCKEKNVDSIADIKWGGGYQMVNQ